MPGNTAGALVDVLVPALAAALLCAGLTKLAVPGPTRAALAELAPGLAGLAGPAVRLLALAETATAVALLTPPLRAWGAVAVTLLGLVFTGAGVAGRVRRATVPCGCYGRAGGAPLGPGNILIGLLGAVLGVVLWRLDGPAAPAGAAMLAGVTAIAVCLLTAALYRRLIQAGLRPVVTTGREERNW
jgi:hypothetical protein